MLKTTLIVLGMLGLLSANAVASVVDASAAEEAYGSGDYKTALALFEQAADDFREASTDSSEPDTYREATYIFDRLADCCFTQRDWSKLKFFLDGLLVVSISERNLCETRLSGALASGISRASAQHLTNELDEAVRLSTLFQLKRSLALVLYDTGGHGDLAAAAITQYQALAAAMLGVVYLEDGLYQLDVDKLEQKVGQFDAIFDSLEGLGDIDALWEKYPPGPGEEAIVTDEPTATQ